MPSLQVRELPEHIYRRLRQEAEIEHRSIAQQAVAAIARGLSLDPDPKARRCALLDEIRAGSGGAVPVSLPDPVDLIREDRDR
jgi:plasmid stability protein